MTIASVSHVGRHSFRAHPWERWIQGQGFEKRLNAAAISITDPDSDAEEIPKGFEKRIRLQFWDVTETTNDLCFTPADAKLVYNFIRELAVDQREWELVVHCEAGLSRSASVATFVAQKYSLLIDWDHAKFANPLVLRLLREADPDYKRPFE